MTPDLNGCIRALAQVGPGLPFAMARVPPRLALGSVHRPASGNDGGRCVWRRPPRRPSMTEDPCHPAPGAGEGATYGRLPGFALESPSPCSIGRYALGGKPGFADGARPCWASNDEQSRQLLPAVSPRCRDLEILAQQLDLQADSLEAPALPSVPPIWSLTLRPSRGRALECRLKPRRQSRRASGAPGPPSPCHHDWTHPARLACMRAGRALLLGSLLSRLLRVETICAYGLPAACQAPAKPWQRVRSPAPLSGAIQPGVQAAAPAPKPRLEP